MVTKIWLIMSGLWPGMQDATFPKSFGLRSCIRLIEYKKIILERVGKLQKAIKQQSQSGGPIRFLFLGQMIVVFFCFFSSEQLFHLETLKPASLPLTLEWNEDRLKTLCVCSWVTWMSEISMRKSEQSHCRLCLTWIMLLLEFLESVLTNTVKKGEVW